MKYEFIFFIAVAIFIVAIPVTAMVSRFRRAFLVPEGYAGLLYRKGKFVQALGVGRHIRWGRHLSWNALDMRKTSLLVAGQEVINPTKENFYENTFKARPPPVPTQPAGIRQLLLHRAHGQIGGRAQ